MRQISGLSTVNEDQAVLQVCVLVCGVAIKSELRDSGDTNLCLFLSTVSIFAEDMGIWRIFAGSRHSQIKGCSSSPYPNPRYIIPNTLNHLDSFKNLSVVFGQYLAVCFVVAYTGL